MQKSLRFDTQRMSYACADQEKFEPSLAHNVRFFIHICNLIELPESLANL
jgi:hypothetical protein